MVRGGSRASSAGGDAVGRVTIGVDVGSKVDHSAVAIVEAEDRGGVEHYILRQVQRAPLGLSYDEIVPWIAEGVRVTVSMADGLVLLLVDATGVGLPVVDLLVSAGAEPLPVYFTMGERVIVTGDPGPGIRDLAKRDTRKPGDIKVSIGKYALVSRMQALLNNNRLHMLRDDPAVAEMVEELLAYEIRPNISNEDVDQYGAFEVGTHDDIATALGLAVHLEMWTREWTKWRKLAREFGRSRRRRRGPIKWESVPGVADWGKPADDERARSSVYDPPKQ